MTESNTQTMEFRAEVQQLLNILANSLYTEREIFCRELISNASDALHRLQFEMLTQHDVVDPQAELAIHLDFDAEARTLTVADNGIGMTREELIENLGTIAHSGAMAFLERLEQGRRPTDIIGQFGVGFYSVFMVAEEVVVTTRSYRPEAQAWRWSSRGGSEFSLAPAEKPDRGTTIEVKLKEDAAEFASSWRLRQVVKKHSDYVSFPIYIEGELINQQTALWRQSPQEVEGPAYADFYRQLTLDFAEPLLYVHLVSDAPVDLRSILYVPASLERGPLQRREDYGLQLYARKILIQQYNKDLLPEYLRFVEGVVDSEDIPLNISRETVQRSPALRQIRRALTGRLLKELRGLAEQDAARYGAFWSEFGPFIKQGVATSPSDHEDLLPLLRFYSSRSEDALISLADYVGRMATEQEAIYYVLGHDRAAMAHSPHLDAFRAQDIEVLYLLDPLDGFVMQSLHEFEGQPFQNVDDPDLELPRPDEAPETPEEAVPADIQPLLARFGDVLGERVTEVRESKVLSGSPCRLVSAEAGPERELQRLRRLLEQDFELQPKILEINRRHPLIQSLGRRLESDPDDALLDLTIEQLFENLLLLEGLHPNPSHMVPRLQSLLEAALDAGERD